MVVRHEIVFCLRRESLKVDSGTIGNHKKIRDANELEFHAVQPSFVGSEDNGHPSKSNFRTFFEKNSKKS